jgi:DNA polymerase-1
VSVEVIRTAPALAALVSRATAGEEEEGCGAAVAVELFTDSSQYMCASLVGAAVAINATIAAYVPIAHVRKNDDVAADHPVLSLAAALEGLRPLFESDAVRLVGYDAKRLAHALAAAYATDNNSDDDAGMRLSLRVAEVAEDPALQSYVLNPAFPERDAASLASTHANASLREPAEVLGKGTKAVPWATLPVDDAAEFAAQRVVAMWRVHRQLQWRLQAEPELLALYIDMERPLRRALTAMERHGVLVDSDALLAQGRQLGDRMGEIEAAAHSLAGMPFNLASPKQLAEVEVQP